MEKDMDAGNGWYKDDDAATYVIRMGQLGMFHTEVLYKDPKRII